MAVYQVIWVINIHCPSMQSSSDHCPVFRGWKVCTQILILKWWLWFLALNHSELFLKIIWFWNIKTGLKRRSLFADNHNLTAISGILEMLRWFLIYRTRNWLRFYLERRKLSAAQDIRLLWTWIRWDACTKPNWFLRPGKRNKNIFPQFTVEETQEQRAKNQDNYKEQN